MRAKYYRLKESLQAYEAIEYLECLTGARLSPDEMLEVIESQKVPCYLDMLAIPIDAHIIQSDGRLKAAIMPTALQRFLGGIEEDPYLHLKASTELEQVHFLISPGVAGSEWLEKHYPWFNQLFLNGEIKAVESGEVETVTPTATIATLINHKEAIHDDNKYRRELYLLDVDCIEGGVSYPNAYWGIHRDFFTPEREEIALEALFKPIDIEALAANMNNEQKAQALQQEIETLKAEVERLQAENTALKAENEKLGRSDDTRQTKNMAKVIYGMAVSRYQYNPELQRNEATGVIVRAMQAQGIQTTASTIKRYIDTGKTALEEDGK